MISLIQLKYIIAIDTYRHFVTASEKCFVTQPTLSMQIKKLEEDNKRKCFNCGNIIDNETLKDFTNTEVCLECIKDS